MQAEIRASDPTDFPLHARFVGYHADGKLRSAREVAERVLPVLLWHPSEMSGQRFDVNQPDLDAVLARCVQS